jgi:hypothetical protein
MGTSQPEQEASVPTHGRIELHGDRQLAYKKMVFVGTLESLEGVLHVELDAPSELALKLTDIVVADYSTPEWEWDGKLPRPSPRIVGHYWVGDRIRVTLEIERLRS